MEPRVRTCHRVPNLPGQRGDKTVPESESSAELPILVVDDDVTFLSFMMAALARLGRPYVIAISGGQALAILRKTKVRAVLLDRKLPDRDGVDVLREIVKNPEPPQVILVSGAASIESAREAGALGAVAYLEKPVRISDLLALVDRVPDSNGRKVPPHSFNANPTNHEPTSSTTSAGAAARLVEVVLRASRQPVDFRNGEGLAKIANVGYGTMRHWCRFAQVPGRSFVRFARGFWATAHALRTARPPIELLDCLDIECSTVLDPTLPPGTTVEQFCACQVHLIQSHPVVLGCLQSLLSTDLSVRPTA